MLVRDYALGDLAQRRLAGGARQKRLAENFYARGDGTRAFYFSQACTVPVFLQCRLKGVIVPWGRQHLLVFASLVM